MLTELHDELTTEGIALTFARIKGPVRDTFARGQDSQNASATGPSTQPSKPGRPRPARRRGLGHAGTYF